MPGGDDSSNVEKSMFYIAAGSCVVRRSRFLSLGSEQGHAEAVSKKAACFGERHWWRAVSCSAGLDWRWYMINVGHRRRTRKVAKTEAFGDLAYDDCSRPFSAIYQDGATEE